MKVKNVKKGQPSKISAMLRSSIAYAIFLSAAGALLVSQNTYAEEQVRCTDSVAHLVSMDGQAEWQASSAEQWQQAKIGDRFCYGDSLKVTQYRAALKLDNDTLVRLNEGTTVKFIQPETSFWLELIEGVAYFISRTPKKFTVKAPYMNASIDGTEFLVEHKGRVDSVSVFEGAVLTSNEKGSLLTKTGETVAVTADQAPRLAAQIRLQDSADWALYYPPLFINNKLPENLAEYLARGDYSSSLELIAAMPDALTNPDYLALKSAIALHHGQVGLAEKNMAEALAVNANHPLSLSLQVLVTLVKGDSKKALKNALILQEKLPNNAAVNLALSYAQQSAFQLDKAFASAVKAADLAETESLAWARVAELALSLGKTRQAASAAKKALELNPSFSRAYSIKGFLALKRHQPDTAFKYFTQALERDPADSLARFALGLADIRRGRLKQGRESLELAVALNPGNSLFRSYLGKAYFEENRNAVAGAQFDLAKQLDPDDPTPWFYQAILLQSQNQPDEALKLMTESIALNDSRAVYRSRLMLDADEAARQASQADIYLDLGFDVLAKRTAAKSLAKAPGEHGSHRLLAESLINDQRSDIARSSEVLQAQLLQPLTAIPIRSVLAESDLLVIEGTGPGKLGTNEFNTLFNSNDLYLQSSGLTGSNRTNASDTVVSGLLGPVSFALGDYNYQTDGFRANNDLEYDISTAFIQAQLSDSLSVMVEGRSRKEDRGDLAQRFLDGVFSESERFESKTKSSKTGFHYILRPEFEVLGVFNNIEKNQEFASETVSSTPFFDVLQKFFLEVEERANAAEFQFIFNQDNYNAVSGFKVSEIDREELELIEISGLPGPPIPPSATLGMGKVDYDNVYSYWNTELNDMLQILFGMSYVKFNDPVTLEESFSQWNPKLGVHLKALENLNIRAAGFRQLQGPLIIEQTLEPTHIAGFNQFLDDSDATDSRNYALGFDYQTTADILTGFEAVYRDKQFPVVGSLSEQEVIENLYSVYLLWVLNNWSLSFNYYDERQKYKTDIGFANTPIKLSTKRVPLNFNYNHPKGLTLSVEPSYINQQAEFREEFDKDLVIVAKDNFWILDLSAKYWFWQKRGVLAFEVKNAGKKKFQYYAANFQDSSPRPIIYTPERTFLGRISIAF